MIVLIWWRVGVILIGFDFCCLAALHSLLLCFSGKFGCLCNLLYFAAAILKSFGVCFFEVELEWLCGVAEFLALGGNGGVVLGDWWLGRFLLFLLKGEMGFGLRGRLGFLGALDLHSRQYGVGFHVARKF